MNISTISQKRSQEGIKSHHNNFGLSNIYLPTIIMYKTFDKHYCIGHGLDQNCYIIIVNGYYYFQNIKLVIKS